MQSQRLPFKPSPVVAERCRAFNRTEDVAFSPDQTHLAIADHNSNRIVVLRIRTAVEEGALSVVSEACVALQCPDFNRPHGVVWIDNATLAVANRGTDVTIVPVPPTSAAGEVLQVEPLLRLSEGRKRITHTPGSVAVLGLDAGHVDLLVCNNRQHNVTRHILSRTNRYEVLSEARLFDFGKGIPDGIAVSRDGEFLAVSNHHEHRVEVFRNDADAGPQSRPAFVLGIPCYPHGIRFAMDDRLFLVADAGAPLVYVFARGKDGWADASEPKLSIRVMDDETFQRGHINPAEGGPKGLDLLADGSLLAITCKEVPIAFFDFRPVRDGLLGTEVPIRPEPRSGERRMLDAVMTTVKGQMVTTKGQQAEIDALQVEVAVLRERLKPKWYQGLDRRFRRWLNRAARKALRSEKKR